MKLFSYFNFTALWTFDSENFNTWLISHATYLQLLYYWQMGHILTWTVFSPMHFLKLPNLHSIFFRNVSHFAQTYLFSSIQHRCASNGLFSCFKQTDKNMMQQFVAFAFCDRMPLPSTLLFHQTFEYICTKSHSKQQSTWMIYE